MERLEKLVNLLEKKYGNTNITESNKVEIRKIISEEIARVTESLEEVDDSQTSMTYASLERAMKYSKGIYKKMKEQNIEDVDGWVFAKITLADDYLKSVYSYLDGNDGLKEDEQLDHAFNDAKPVDEESKRDYKKEYAKYGKSEKSKKYRAELNKYNRDKGTYGNGDGKDASHKGGKIVGFESESKNRGRAEKSRLKKK